MVQNEIKKELQGSFLHDAPIIPVSAKTKQGVPELKAAINNLAQTIKKEARTDLFRLPIDRVFTIKGHGTVVTGTILSGIIKEGETLEIMPGHLETKARSIERHEEEMTEVSFGSRCAINLQGLDKAALERGQIVTKKGQLLPEKHWYVRLTNLASAPHPLRNRQEIHFHHGSKELPARIVLRDRQALQPGESAFAEVIFEQEMCGVFNDHAVIRSGSPLQTIAGCLILAPIPPKSGSKANKDACIHSRYLTLPNLYEQAILGQLKDRAQFVLTVLELLSLPGADINKLRVATALSAKSLEKALELLASQHKIVLFDHENPTYLSQKDIENLSQKLLARAQQLHDLAPLKPAFARQALFSDWCQGLPAKLLDKLLDICLKACQIVVEGDGLRLATHKVNLAGSNEDLAKKIMAFYLETPLTPPNFKDVLEQLNKNAKEVQPILTHLLDSGQLVKIKDGLYYQNDTLDDILTKVRDWFKDHDNLDIAAIKSFLPLSRKYLVALLEYMDNAHITIRVGDKRILRKTNS